MVVRREPETDDQIRDDLIRDLRTLLDTVATARMQREVLIDLRRRAREMGSQVRGSG
jgi:hypothetical protein